MSESIVVDHVSKRFTMRYHRTIKQMSIAMLRGQDLSDPFLAVDDVSFTVQQGESIGLMGLNGSGKSTLLKLINGVMRPDSGKVLTRGRIAGLIATGAGFHPQLTGRENIFLNAAVLGMTEAETQRKFDDIVEFADIGKFLDSPVGHYSSGQFSRLGFAVAVHLDPEVILVDDDSQDGTVELARSLPIRARVRSPPARARARMAVAMPRRLAPRSGCRRGSGSPELRSLGSTPRKRAVRSRAEREPARAPPL